MEVRDAFIEEGGETYHYIPALNADDLWIETMAQIAKEHLVGWRDANWNAALETAQGADQRQAALALGSPQ